jgi:hypothetical protein
MDLIGQQNMEEIKPFRHEHKQLKGTLLLKQHDGHQEKKIEKKRGAKITAIPTTISGLLIFFSCFPI